MQQMEEGNEDDRAMAAKYIKAIEKDQIAKLLCFCTRPAIYSPAYNWLCEFMSTIVLVRSADDLQWRREGLQLPCAPLCLVLTSTGSGM